MKLYIVTIIMAVLTFAANANAADAVELFIGDINGVTDQDIRLCRGSYINGGKYYHHFNNAKLTCTRQHISVDFDHSSEE